MKLKKMPIILCLYFLTNHINCSKALFLFVQLTHLYLYWHKYITSKNSVIVPHHNILHIFPRQQNIVIILCHIKRQTSTLSFMENLFFVCSQGVIDVCSCFTNIFQIKYVSYNVISLYTIYIHFLELFFFTSMHISKDRGPK